MGKYRRLSHVVYQCTYHVVWVPKYRYRILTGAVAELMDRDIRMLCEWKDVEVLELNVQVDHVHALLSIPPKISISTFMGFLKGKLAIKVMKSYPRLRKKPYWGNHFWARGYFVSTVGLNEDLIRRYVKYQEEQEQREETERRDYDLFQRPPSNS
jgi:REP-associated tyrosine transposase